VVGRALFAFQALERDADGIESEDAMLGADLKADRDQAIIDIRDMLVGYFQARREAVDSVERNR
jgi:hypothetical protein